MTIITGKRAELRSISLFRYATWEFNDKALSPDNRPFKMLTFDEVRESITQRILKLGFSKVERVDPFKANCIIRVFQKQHYAYKKYDLVYNLYGAACYVLKNGKWVTSGFSDNYVKIDYSKFLYNHQVRRNEYITFDCEFVDYYVNIS